MEKQHTDYPSRYSIGESALITLDNISFHQCTIESIRFTESKVFYDVKIFISNFGEYILRDVDSLLISDL